MGIRNIKRKVRKKSRCHYCNKPTPPNARTIDHKNPVSRGGSRLRGNLVMACRSCNLLKGCMTEAEFRAIREEL